MMRGFGRAIAIGSLLRPIRTPLLPLPRNYGIAPRLCGRQGTWWTIPALLNLFFSASACMSAHSRSDCDSGVLDPRKFSEIGVGINLDRAFRQIRPARSKRVASWCPIPFFGPCPSPPAGKPRPLPRKGPPAQPLPTVTGFSFLPEANAVGARFSTLPLPTRRGKHDAPPASPLWKTAQPVFLTENSSMTSG
jgi:hypothetical protein